jgi:hypothetical protein
MKLEERLNDIISEKDDKIEELERTIADLVEQQDLTRLKWQMHSAFQNDDFYKLMPYPRLEMRFNRLSKDDWYSIEWVYGLVYKHSTDVNNDTLIFVPMSRTESSGGDTTFDNWVDSTGIRLPYRDGLHIYAESVILDLPAYIVCREKLLWNKIENQGWYLNDILPKMKPDF